MLIPVPIVAVGEGDGTVHVCAVLSSIENIAKDINLVFRTTQATGTS